jgi:hypothetical protein
VRRARGRTRATRRRARISAAFPPAVRFARRPYNWRQLSRRLPSNQPRRQKKACSVASTEKPGLEHSCQAHGGKAGFNPSAQRRAARTGRDVPGIRPDGGRNA